MIQTERQTGTTVEVEDLLELLSGCSDGMYAIDADQRVVVWNKHAEEILGWTAKEVLGKRCFEALSGHSDTQNCSAGCSVVLLATKGVVAPSHNILTRDKNGHQKWLSISHVLIPSDSHKLGALVHIFRDATEAIEASNTLQRLASIVRNDPKPAATSKTETPQTPTTEQVTLSTREVEVLRLLAQGLGSAQIAEKLFLSHVTVRNHIQHILEKLNVHSRLEAVISATRLSLL